MVTACGTSSQAPSGGPSPVTPVLSILVFSRTEGFRHDSIPAGITAIQQQGRVRGFTVEATENGGVFTDEGLARYKAVVFLSTTGDVLTAVQQEVFERFIRRGGGFVGVHAAADTEYDWPFYGGLVGAYFASHPEIQSATTRVENQSHPATAALPRVWTRRDEWYDFRSNPRGRVSVAATLDETTYAGGQMGSDHPIMWFHSYEGGRSWYSAGGHTAESFSEPLFADHLGYAVLWAAGAI